MGIGTVKIMNAAVTKDKLETTAAKTIQLAAGEKFIVKDADGFTLIEADNDTKKIKIKGNIEKV